MLGPINHKFEQKTWNNDFFTQNGILVTKYQPEVLFIGTYNPAIEEGNAADIFYGRNYFWPALWNLSQNEITLSKRRLRKGKEPEPSLEQVFHLCQSLKLGFADLIKSVLNPNTEYQLGGRNRNAVIFENKAYNLFYDDDLKELASLQQVSWNTSEIVSFIIRTKSIRWVYLTRKSQDSFWDDQWNEVSNEIHYSGRDIEFIKINSPSARGLGRGQRMKMLLRKWIIEEQFNPSWVQCAFGSLDRLRGSIDTN